MVHRAAQLSCVLCPDSLHMFLIGFNMTPEFEGIETWHVDKDESSRYRTCGKDFLKGKFNIRKHTPICWNQHVTVVTFCDRLRKM